MKQQSGQYILRNDKLNGWLFFLDLLRWFCLVGIVTAFEGGYVWQ